MTQASLRAQRREVLKRIEADVRKHGQSVMYIFGDENEPPFHYTVGRARRGLPELLLVLPIRPEIGMSMLNQIDTLMPQPVPSGTLLSLGGPFPVKIVDADERAKEYTMFAGRFSKDNYRVQQVLLCDPQGRFPPDCAPPYDAQPLLLPS